MFVGKAASRGWTPTGEPAAGGSAAQTSVEGLGEGGFHWEHGLEHRKKGGCSFQEVREHVSQESQRGFRYSWELFVGFDVKKKRKTQNKNNIPLSLDTFLGLLARSSPFESVLGHLAYSTPTC